MSTPNPLISPSPTTTSPTISNSSNSTTSTTSTSLGMSFIPKDRRSNRRRVSCGFHHKRHQACPENCEGRVSHPSETHAPVQDKFTVGCSECKSFFQNKLFILTSSVPATPTTTATTNLVQPQHVSKKRAVVLPEIIESNSNNKSSNVSFHLIDTLRNAVVNSSTLSSSSSFMPSISVTPPASVASSSATTSPLVQSNEFEPILLQSSPYSSSPSNSRPMSPIGEVPSMGGYKNYPTSPFKSSSMIDQFPVKFDNDPPEPLNQPLPQRRVSGSITSASSYKRKMTMSPELVSDESSPSYVPDESPSITPRPSSFSCIPTFSSSTSSSSSSVESGLLHLIEAGEKEIFSQNEQELSQRKKIQREEKETVDRIQQVLDYQKVQQQIEFHRLKKQNDDLEVWKSQLDMIEKDLLVKEECLKRRVETIVTTVTTPIPKPPINTTLLKNVSSLNNNNNELAPIQDIISKSTTTSNNQFKPMSFDILLNQKQQQTQQSLLL